MKRESLRKKKKRARAIRGDGKEFVRWEEGPYKGSDSSHLMYHEGKKAWPSVFPNKKGSHDPKDWEDIPDKKKSLEEAEKRGEVFEFKRERQAKKFGHGSWKKGKDKRKAMKGFRESNRKERKKRRFNKKFDKALAKSYM